MRKIWTIIAMLAALAGHAQDMHFTQFFATPMFTNPAFTGDFKGTYRFSGVGRSQWSSISSQPFRTFGGGVDMNAPFNLKPLGVGLHLAQDQAGVSILTRQQAHLFLAGHIPFGASKDIILSLGAQLGFSRQMINNTGVRFDRQYNGSAYDPNLPSGEQLNDDPIQWLSPAGGAYLQKKYSKRKHFGVGVSLFNLNEPNISAFESADANLPRRLNVHGMSSLPFATRWDVMPAFQLMRQGPHSELLVGSSVRYHLSETPLNKQAILLGVWGRPGDAGNVSLGVEMNSLFVGGSYDVNFSSLQPASRYRGGWEVTVIYILSTVREKVKRVRQCPDYI